MLIRHHSPVTSVTSVTSDTNVTTLLLLDSLPYSRVFVKVTYLLGSIKNRGRKVAPPAGLTLICDGTESYHGIERMLRLW